MATSTENAVSPTTEKNYDVTYQPSPDASDFFHKTPVLPTSHVVIVCSSQDKVSSPGADKQYDVGRMFSEGLGGFDDMEPYTVKLHDVTQPISDEELYSDIRSCLKVIFVFSRNLFLSEARLKKEWEAAKSLTSERHLESVIPVFHGMTPEELPLIYQYGSIMPSGYKENCIKTNERTLDLMIKKISETVPIGTGGLSGIGVGLAWGHFFGWLSICLHGLNERVMQTAQSTCGNWDIPAGFKVHPKMIAIIPKNGYSAEKRSLTAYDEDVKPLMKKVRGADGQERKEPVKAKYTQPMIGYPDKDYSNPLHWTTVGGETYAFVAEVPTTLKTIKELSRTDYAPNFDEDDHKRELLTFMAQLDRIFASNSSDEHSETRRQAITMVYFDEETEKLSEVIGNAITNDVGFNNAPWRSTSAGRVLPA